MEDWISIDKNDKHVRKEREKARELRKTVFWQKKLQEGICHYCGKKFTSSDLTLDHIVPVARGGKSTKGNCVPCCKHCNNEKSLLTPVEMILKKMKDERE